MEKLIIRNVLAGDNQQLAAIIRNTLEEFKANRPGTVYYDDRTDRIFEEFLIPKSQYFVAAYEGEILGGGGIYPTEGLPEDTCEFVKFYLAPAGRGKGIGKQLFEKSLEAAREMGYKKVYLETMPELIIAIPMYERAGFNYLDKPQGNSGHGGCAIWMIKEF